VIFVHGCFWHGHDCRRGARAPKENAEYWRKKIERNQNRDAKTISALKDDGWKVLIIWECETRDIGVLSARLTEFLD